jgi:hypothetical protein
MIVLNEMNELVNTDFVNESFHFGVLSFSDFSNPDFMFRETTHLMVYNAAGISLELGLGKDMQRIVVPLHWWILCAELDEVQTIPLTDLNRTDHKAFCFNPINGYRPEYLNLRVATGTPTIYPNANWTSPPVGERDLVLIPLGKVSTGRPNAKGEVPGPLCAMFSTNKFEVSGDAANLWGDAPKPKKAKNEPA